MVRANIKMFLVLIAVLINSLFGCSSIGYNNNDNKNKVTSTTETKRIIGDRKEDFISNNGIIQKPIPHINDLATFLNKYDCSVMADTDSCYEKTRAKLIQITKELDEAESKIYKLRRTTGTLRTN